VHDKKEEFQTEKSLRFFFFYIRAADPPFGGIFCNFLYKTYKDCEINNYQLNDCTKHGKIRLSIGGQSGKRKGI
jgi:hypothetical protein